MSEETLQIMESERRLTTIFLITDVLRRIGGKKKKKNESRNRDVSPPLCHRRPLRRVETQRRPGQ